jgi:hypothetical protein
MEKPFSIFYATSWAKGVNQGSLFNTSINDNQPIINKGMGGGDHQTP